MKLKDFISFVKKRRVSFISLFIAVVLGTGCITSLKMRSDDWNVDIEKNNQKNVVFQEV